jgi:hypothetical protein
MSFNLPQFEETISSTIIKLTDSNNLMEMFDILLTYESNIHNLFFPEPDIAEINHESTKRKAVVGAAYQLKIFMEVYELYKAHVEVVMYNNQKGYNSPNKLQEMCSEITDVILYLMLNLSQVDKTYRQHILDSINAGLIQSYPKDQDTQESSLTSENGYRSVNHALNEYVNELSIGFNSNWHRTDKPVDIELICRNTTNIIKTCFDLYHQIAELLHPDVYTSATMLMFKSEIRLAILKFNSYILTKN